MYAVEEKKKKEKEITGGFFSKFCGFKSRVGLWRMIIRGGGFELTTPFLSFSSFMILKPIENIFAFNLTVPSKLCCDLLDLFS